MNSKKIGKIFCCFGLHRWGPAFARILDQGTIVYVYNCNRCGKHVEGRERRNCDKSKQPSLFASEL